MNYFFLIAGALALFLSVAHMIWGGKFVLKDLKQSNLPEITGVGFYISYAQAAVVLLVEGAGLVIASFYNGVPGMEILVWFILAVIVGNFLVFLVTGLVKCRKILTQSIPQIIFFTIMISSIILGIFL